MRKSNKTSLFTDNKHIYKQQNTDCDPTALQRCLQLNEFFNAGTNFGYK